MQRELFNHMFEEFIKCFRPFKRAAMMLMRPTVKFERVSQLNVFTTRAAYVSMKFKLLR